ncbi:putative metal-dependent hydrolase [Kroppenstedtia guangzhouensis]|uniref:Metal-dependent hydrolase n=1 Tax=Kroppenstedtia guangzhouensis TaxID=1274356 RepID=A0ABQ1H1V7_9BACL|nr:putative metal-dependent hydrolase [Kroppenstedtia guangzhouensis]GGA54914.1 putative metal-dependent hydrolase [Kroppenstedtia guangzhouensis]
MEHLRYPIGRFNPDREKESHDWHIWMLAETPQRLKDAVSDLDREQLDTPYRPGGWTLRQVVHHLPDSHLYGYLRFKRALTEERPTVSPFDQDRWSHLPDSKLNIDVSIDFLDALHQRWVGLLHSMRSEQFQKGYRHPEWGFLTLETSLRLYSWHCRHHLAHISSLRERMNW